VTVGEATIALVVRGLSDKRGPATAAALLYEETEDSRERRERERDLRRVAPPPGADLHGRPSKRDRRRLDAQRAGSRRRGTG
jgi:ribosome-associated heat shock protein Hsp15